MGSCGGSILKGGCSKRFMQQHINELQHKFIPVDRDWTNFKSSVCTYHKWTVCPHSPHAMLVALHSLEPEQSLGCYSGLVPLGLLVVLAASYLLRSFKWKQTGHGGRYTS